MLQILSWDHLDSQIFSIYFKVSPAEEIKNNLRFIA